MGYFFPFLLLTLLDIFFLPLYLVSTIFFIIAGIDRAVFYIYCATENDAKIMDSITLLRKKGLLKKVNAPPFPNSK